MNRIVNYLILCILFMSIIPLVQLSAQLPTDEEYVQAKQDGHLYLKGERIRFWGAIGNAPAKTYKENELMVKRIKELGFNMFRYGAKVSEYVKGDGSEMDLFDHFLYCCKKEGIYVWFTGLNRFEEIGPEDAGIIDDPGSEQAWKDAISQLKGDKSACWAWDDRILAYRKKHKAEVLEHFNQHTELRYADDPVFAVFELTNEEWWFHRVKRGQFLKLPDFFLKELYAKWNVFLQEKYTDNASLSAAWTGNLMPGESLENKSILLLPLMEDFRDEQASSLGVGIDAGSLKNAFSQDNFNGKRGADVIEFLLKIWLDYKSGEAEIVKSVGKASRLVPLVWDTGIGFDLPTQFMQQHADAISHDSYWNGAFITDPRHKRFPWMSQLEELPKTGWDDPWLEHNKMEGKPFFVYETQIMQPAKYRAEYPMEIVKLASIQDWDIINWHYWGHPVSVEEDKPYDQAMDYPTKSHYTQGYHYQFDEVQQSAMTAAGEIFKNFLLKPAENPTKVIIGRQSLYSWGMNNYGQLGKSFTPTVYHYGMRLLIDPSKEKDEVIGPVIKNRGVYESCPIEPTNEISHDWQKGHLIFDASGVVSYTGFYAQYGGSVKFSNGVELSGVTIKNPPAMLYPVKENEKYISFSIVSTDGEPLGKTKKAYLSLVSSSFNSGFSIDEDKHANRPYTSLKEWGWDLTTMNPGKAPVLVARVGASIKADELEGMNYRMLDWHFQVIKEGRIKNGKIIIPESLPVFLIELTR